MTTQEVLKLKRKSVVSKINSTPETPSFTSELRKLWKELRVIDEQIKTLNK